jgi:hypothetical protein
MDVKYIFTLREEHRTRVFQSRLLRIIGCKVEEVTED